MFLNVSVLKKSLFFIGLILGAYVSMAQVFEVKSVTYEVLKNENLKTVAVKGLVNQNINNLEIPATVEFKGVSYEVTAIATDAFKFSVLLNKVTLPATLKEIGSGAFMSCIHLKGINIPESVVTIGDYAFESCENLEKIILPNSIESLGSFAFARCLQLNSIWMSNSVQVLGNDAFRDCANLTIIRIPSSVKKIGEDIFYNCTNLTSISVDYRQPILIGEINNSLQNITLHVPKGTSMLFKNAPVWKEFGKIVEEFDSVGLAFSMD